LQPREETIQWRPEFGTFIDLEERADEEDVFELGPHHVLAMLSILAGEFPSIPIAEVSDITVGQVIDRESRAYRQARARAVGYPNARVRGPFLLLGRPRQP
jgi:hypothetical protein